MTKIKLIKIVQHEFEFFFMVADPRVVIRASKIPEASIHQDIQRPWDAGRVKEIASYVAKKKNLAEGYKDEALSKERYSKGLIPNCPILDLTKMERITEEGGESFIEIKEEDKDLFNILDGQHRLIAFDDRHIDVDFANSEEVYQMGFIVWKAPRDDIKREMFMICNNKQEKVKSDILVSLMYDMKILTGEKETNYIIVKRLNEENMSPLKGRIKLGGNKIRNGLAATQLMDILKKSDIMSKFKNKETGVDVDAAVEKISAYIAAWYSICNGAEDNRHTLRKISGIRYMMFLAPYVFEYCRANQRKWNKEGFEFSIKKLNEETGCFDRFNKSYGEGEPNPFAGETPTVALAKNDGRILQETSTDFDPM